MTVLQVCAFAAPSGGNFITSLTYLENKLKEKGIDTIYAFADGAEDKPWCKEIMQRTKVYFLPTAKARILPKTYQIFRQIYRENDVSVMHSHFELYDMPATVTAPRHVKVFWHLHDALMHNFQKTSTGRQILYRMQYGWAGKRATMLTVSKEHGAFAAELGFPAQQITYFPNGINTDRISPAPLLKNQNQFLMFGWEVRRKGVDLVVKAAEKASGDFCIRIVGQTECEKYLADRCTSPKVAFQYPVENIGELYASAKAFLHVSRAEGLSYALLEVIYAGIPVICSDIPENRFAESFRNVFFVANENVKEVAQKIEELTRWDGQLSEEDVRYNREVIRREYSKEAWANKLINLYMEC